MRRSSDLPRRRRITGRAVLITLGVLFLVVVIFGRAVARFYVDYLWYSSLGRGDVFWGQITAKLTLFAVFAAIFAVLAGSNLYIADRLAPKTFPANVHPYVERFHEVFGRRLRPLRYGVAALFGLMLALPTTSQWQNWLLFRNKTEFGVADPQFGADVGFYMFELPFLSFVLDWLFVAVLVTLLLTAATHVLNGGVVFASPVPSVRSASKAHIAVLLAVLAAFKAADYWVSRYDLTNTQRGFVQGATYAVVKAQVPALMLLMLVAVLTAGLFLVSIRTGSWRLPLLASALWVVVALIGGLIFPALIQRLVVKPNQQAREAPYIERNVEATRAALDIKDVKQETVSFGDLIASEIEDDPEPLRDVRLLNPAEMKTRFQVDEGNRTGLVINDLDVDRYKVDDRAEQVLVAARELELSSIANRSWQGQHLINTRGCGLVMAPTSVVSSDGDPDYREVELERPELYFSPALDGYAVVDTDETEVACPSGGESAPYSGEKGVRMSSFTRRAAFALAFLDYNVLGSGAINADSQMLWVRDVRERVHKLAPFLSFDGDPYPVAVGGRVVWVIDGYTTSSRYPYAQRIGGVQLTPDTGLSSSDNYVRNSVKATVDAYDGSVTLYVTEPTDPILKAWRGAFPDLFTDDIPTELREHFRYPEDLFRVQTDMYSKYQLEPGNFFSRSGAWSVAQAPTATPQERGTAAGTVPQSDAASNSSQQDFAAESSTGRFTPYYTYFHDAPDGIEQFVMIRPFVPFSPNDARTELQAYMTASSDPATYGQLVAYEVEGEEPEDGPLGVAREVESQADISREISLQNQRGGGSEVRFGDLQLVPVADGLLWVRPFYVAAPSQSTDVGKVSEFRFVIVSYKGRSAYGASLKDAIADVFVGFDLDVGDRKGGVITTPDDPDDPEEPVEDLTAEQLLTQADELFTEAEADLREGDLGAYQDKIEQAGDLVDQALDLLQGES